MQRGRGKGEKEEQKINGKGQKERKRESEFVPITSIGSFPKHLQLLELHQG